MTMSSEQDYKNKISVLEEDLKKIEQENKALKDELDKTFMDNCILEDDRTELRSFCFMNDVKDLEDLDKQFNELKEKLKSKGSRSAPASLNPLEERIDVISALKLVELVEENIKSWEDDKDFDIPYLKEWVSEYQTLQSLLKESKE